MRMVDMWSVLKLVSLLSLLHASTEATIDSTVLVYLICPGKGCLSLGQGFVFPFTVYLLYLFNFDISVWVQPILHVSSHYPVLGPSKPRHLPQSAKSYFSSMIVLVFFLSTGNLKLYLRKRAFFA